MGKEQVDEKHEIKFFEIIYKLIEFVSALCLCGQVIIISIAVIGRYIFSYTPTWSEEIARVLMVWMSFLTASMAIKDNSHVRISVFDKFFGEKALKIRDIIFSICNIAFSLILFWEGSSHTDFQNKTSRQWNFIRYTICINLCGRITYGNYASL